MKQSTSYKPDEQSVDRRIRRVLGLQLAYIAILFLIMIVAALFLTDLKSQPYFLALIGIQAFLTIGGLAFLSYAYVLPAFATIILQLREQNEQLLKADAMKSEFLSIASHQIKTPLSVIKWSLALLLKADQPTSANQKTLLAQAKTSAETVIKLVGNLLNLSRMEQGRLAYHPVPTEVTAIIRSIVNDALPLAKLSNISIVAQLPSTKLDLTVDPLLFREVIQNLVDNAIAYNKPGGSVTVTARELGRHWLFDVADTGMGIKPTELKNLFTKFYRTSQARSIRPDGSGLGLYFIKKIAALHGGTIKGASQYGQGTIFTLVLPKT